LDYLLESSIALIWYTDDMSAYTPPGIPHKPFHVNVTIWVGSSLTSHFSTNTAISETKGQGWRVILLPSEGRLSIY